jgi:integrase
MSHIEKCRNLWYATLKVPAQLQAKIGKTKFKKSLGTADKRRAEALAAPLVALWRAQLRQSAGETDAVHQEALRWREALAAAHAEGDDNLIEVIPSLIVDHAEKLEEKRGLHVAKLFADVALGQQTPTSLHLKEWKASILHLAQKTQDQAAKDVQRLVTQFATLEAITPKAARAWVDTLHQQGLTASSVKRMMSFWRSYWRYLGSVAAVPPNSFPFTSEMVKKTKAIKGDSWVPLPAADVPKLWRAAEEQEDDKLATLIRIGAYSGARIEELCALEVANVDDHAFRIADSKTEAGVREVPIHAAIAPLVKRLCEESDDGYLLSGLTFNKYGDRSNAIGKRFGRLKANLGYGPKHVFHSIRKTVVTLLEDRGVSENLAADIVGHEKPRITYGLYSGGASLPTKTQALALVAYPGTTVKTGEKSETALDVSAGRRFPPAPLVSP